MDDIDREILKKLTENSRINYTELGKMLNLSRVAIKDRVEKLKKENVIEKFTIIVNPEAVGKNISAYFEIDVDPFFLDEVAVKLSKEKEVENLYLMTGSSTLHMHALFQDMKALEKFVFDTVYSLRGITKVQTNTLLKRYKSKSGGTRL